MSQSDFVSRGQALVAAGQFQEAVKVCRLGLLGRPTTIEGRLVLGQALLALKRFDEVLAEMRVALDLDSSSIPAQVLRAEALLRKGDTAPAIEALHKIRQVVPGDPRVMQLLGEAEHGAPSRPSVTHPSVGFVGQGDTRHYPGYSSGSGEPEPGEFTSQTSLARPTARRSAQRPVEDGPTEMTPPPVKLGRGHDPKTGTVEVDPELEGIEVQREGDEDSLVAPPVHRAGARSVKPGTVDLDDEVDDLNETGGVPFAPRRDPAPLPGVRPPGPGTKVRNAVAMPSGVIGAFEDSGPGAPGARPKGKTLPPPFSAPGGPTAPPGARTAPADVPQVPALFAQEGLGPRSKPPTFPPPLTRGKPPTLPPPPEGGRARPGTMPPPAPTDGFGPRSKAPSSSPLASTMVPPAPLPPLPRSPIAAALPTVAAAQPPPPFVQQQAPYPPPPGHAAHHPTMAVPAAQGPWGQEAMNPHVDPRSMAAAQEPTARPAELDPHILALMSGGPPPQQQQHQMMPMHEPAPVLPSHLLAVDAVALPMPPQYTPQGPLRTGVRRPRNKLMIALVVISGLVVIGGGIFAGFKIRAIRLEKKIAAARVRATDVAKADTFAGWVTARDSLASIVGASSTVANRAALARTRALIAYAFDDGVPEAKTAVDQLKGEGGLDGRLAVALAALMRGEPKAAKTATDEAVQGSDADALAQYLAGEAALLSGNMKVAIAAMKLAADKDNRPMFGVGLARAYAAVYDWDEAVVAIDRVLALNPEHPSAVIERANILAESGRIFPGSALGNEVKQQVERVIVAGKQPDDKHSVAPMQVAFASLALARVELARGDLANAKKSVRGATDVNLDDVRFAEETVSTLYALGELGLARSAAEIAQKQYPTSVHLVIDYANILVAQGRANDALDALGKKVEVLALPDGYAARGYAELAIGDQIGAASDFDAALKTVPTHEPSIIGRAWLELASGDVEAATRRVAERMNPKGASAAVQIAYAATLRRSADAAQRDQAKQLLEKLVAAPGGPELFRAQLELARIYRDAGDFMAARAAYERASKGGSIEARLESALVLVEYSKPAQGRELLDKLLEEMGDRPSAAVVIDAARARMLVGAHVDAANLLAMADKMSSVERWKLDRERGRLALRKSDFPGAAIALSRALDGCGSDGETFLLAADVATADKALADKVKALAPERLKGKPEAQIINGKLALAAEKPAEAEAAYKAAKQALKAEKASYRRLAQADFGLAFVEYSRQNNAAAQTLLDLVNQEDPTLVDAYMIETEIAKDKKKAYDFAQTATRYNPDYAYAWLVVGRLAAELKDKRQLTDAIARLTQIAPQGDELKELQKLH